MNRRDFIKKSTLAAGVVAVPENADSRGTNKMTKRPNIVFIMTDQQHFRMLSHAGNPHLKTPNLDKLAEEGIRFGQAYVTNPVCVPSRISMATGSMAGRFGVLQNGHLKTCELPDLVNAHSLGKLMKNAGYETFYGGKVHMPGDLAPENAGYDVVEKDRRSKLAPACAKFIRKEHRKPFFAVASFINPHDICYAHRAAIAHPKGMKTVNKLYKTASTMPLNELPPLPENFSIPEAEPQVLASNLKSNAVTPAAVMRKEYNKRNWRIFRWIYCRLTEIIDGYVGEILDAIQESGQEENTLVLFTSDHGDMDSSHRLASKGLFYEESVKVPLLLKYSGVIPPGTLDTHTLISTGLDIMPTLCDYAEAETPDFCLGRSLRSIAEKNTDPLARQYVPSENTWGRMLRTEQYKYCAYDSGPQRESLVDLNSDPGEMTNLAYQPDYRKILQDHREYMKEWLKKSRDPHAERFMM